MAADNPPLMMQRRFVSWEDAQQNDPLVYRWETSGAPMRELVLTLLNQKAELVERLMKLEAIAPCKYTLPDGQVIIYHCPDELVPER